MPAIEPSRSVTPRPSCLGVVAFNEIGGLMFDEHDVVELKHGVAAESSLGWPGVPGTALRAGAVGTIVAVYDDGLAGRAYEVEFVDSDGSTIGLVTLSGSGLEPVE